MYSKGVVIFSGGLDSSVILKIAQQECEHVMAITYDYGQRHNKEILAAFKQVDAQHHKVVDIKFLQTLAKSSLTDRNIPVAKTVDILGHPQSVNYVPYRNTIMLSIALSYCESIEGQAVYYGAALVDSQAGYWDSSIEYINQINNLSSLNRKTQIKIVAPLITLSKKEIIEKGISLGVNFKDTWTCYEGREKACGYCPACSSRIKGFIDNKVVDPIEYERTIEWSKLFV